MKKIILLMVFKGIFIIPTFGVSDTSVIAHDSSTFESIDSVEVPIGEMLDSIFKTLDPSYIPTHFLIDRSVPFVQWENFHGALADSNINDNTKQSLLHSAVALAAMDPDHLLILPGFFQG